jgi:hypothetical protein
VEEPKAGVGFLAAPGFDVDRHGVAWSRCERTSCELRSKEVHGPLNGPTATGGIVEGWTFYPEPLPQINGVTWLRKRRSSYYTWVDQFDTLGLGRNVPINTGNAAEALLALKDGKFVSLRVPYPIGFFTKWMDGRIDDPKGGWKDEDCSRPSAAHAISWKVARGRRAR